MANYPFVNFGGGEIGKELLGRVTLEGYSAMSEILENILVERAGTALFRPGFELKARPNADNDLTHLLPFIRSHDQAYLVVLSDGEMRIAQDGGIITRPAVTSAVTNGTFSTLTGWTDISTSPGVASAALGGLRLSSNGLVEAGVRQEVATSSAGVVHALDIEVLRGPVTLRIGSSAGATDLGPGGEETAIGKGFHSIAFTPAGASYWVELVSRERPYRVVGSVAVASAGDMVLETPWAEAYLEELEYEQSIDVLFVNYGLTHPKRIERRGAQSWSIVDTDERSGPFLGPNIDEGISLTPSVTQGNGTLASNVDLFNAGHVGALFELTHSGQSASDTVGGANQFTDSIKVQGAGTTARTVSVSISGTFTGTIVVQRSIGNTTSFSNYASYASPTTTSFADGLDNQTIYYKIGFGSDYTSGTADVALTYNGGSSTGIVRVVAFNDAQSVDIEVLETLASTTSTNEWSEGAWSDYRGWPEGIGLFNGRLWEGYGDQYAGSRSDAYSSFGLGENDDDAIIRSIGTGRVENIVSMLPLARLLALTGGAEVEIKGSSFDEPMTPGNASSRNISTHGASPVHPVVVDTQGMFISRSGAKLLEAFYSVDANAYRTRSLMRLHKKIGRPGLRQIAVSREPDTRIWVVRTDGQLLCLIYEPDDNVVGWQRIITNGTVESVAVLPGDEEDEIYIAVNRPASDGGEAVRCIEKLGRLDIESATDARQFDSWVEYVGESTDVVGGFEHLAGREVVVWVDGARHPNVTIDADGNLRLTYEGENISAGLGYTGRYKSSKLAFGAQQGTALTMKGKPLRIAMMLFDSMQILEYGQTFDKMDNLKDRKLEEQYGAGPGLIDGTSEDFVVPGNFTRDPRVCLRMQSPYWVQMHGYVVTSFLNER
ncbi:MAG: hypothetical protein KDI55_00390 [Anaerolineae bacterium]|nr:hypothetical protein [Anaerolineae bacterium]